MGCGGLGLLHLARGPVGLAAQVVGGGALVLEEAGEDGLDEGAEDDLGAAVMRQYVFRIALSWGWMQDLPGLRESHPQDEDELEGVVEWEPVDGVDGGLKHGQEGVDDPVLRSVSMHLRSRSSNV